MIKIKEADCIALELAHIYIYICLYWQRRGAPASTPSPSHGVRVASAVGRHVVGGERDATIGQELTEDMGTTRAGLCELEDEVHVAGGLLFFPQCKIYFALTLLISVPRIFLSFPS